MIPYGKQWVDQQDLNAVARVLESDWLTTGPAVDAFEEQVAAFTGARYGVAVSSGTAALHAAMYALKIAPGDEVIVPPMTFAATANAALYMGATPVFADVEADTLLLNPAEVQAKLTPRTRAVIAVDYAGQPADYTALRALTRAHGIPLVSDACHALGARYQGRKVGTLADLTVFSFHPVKHVTTGEGGMIVTDDGSLSNAMRTFRNHGITTDHRQRSERGSWFYEMVDLGFNYRISDIQCALGSSQLTRLPQWLERRNAIAARYDAAFSSSPEIRPLTLRPGNTHAWHLYVVRLAGIDRQAAFAALRANGIGVNVHYIPVHLHPYYRTRFGFGPGLCPVAESAYEKILSIPMFPRMSDTDVDTVIAAVFDAVASCRISAG